MKRKLVATLLGLFVVFSAFAANLNHVMMTSIKSGNIPVSEGFSSLFDGFWLFAILAAILCIGIAVGLYVLVSIRSGGQVFDLFLREEKAGAKAASKIRGTGL